MNEWMNIEQVKEQNKNLYSHSSDKSGPMCKHPDGIQSWMSSFKDSPANLSTEAECSRNGEPILDLNIS